MYQGDQPTSVPICSVFSNGCVLCVVFECGSFLHESKFSFLDDCDVNVVLCKEVC